MSVIDEMRALVERAEKEYGHMSEIVSAMKTEGGHLSNFGDDFVMLCRKWGIRQSVVAKAVDVTPTSINRRYNRKLKRTDFFYPKKPE